MAAEPRRQQGAAAEAPRSGLGALLNREVGAAWSRIAATPIGTLLTVLVIGIALALPAGLQLLVANARSLAGAWEGATRLSVFAKPGTAEDEIQRLARQLERRESVVEV